MITFDQFIAKWNGKGIDFDDAYGDQCMDLMHQYITEVLGYTVQNVLAAPTAAQVYTNFNNIYGHELFTQIANTPTGVPQKGDILFFKQYSGLYGSAGHVAMFISGDINTIKSFDQNFPTGSKCHIQNHNYNGCLGWLRKKVVTLPLTVREQKIHDIIYSGSNDADVRYQIKQILPK